MKVESIKEICLVLADQLYYESSNIFQRTGELNNEKEVIADMLNEVVEYEHKGSKVKKEAKE